MEPMNRRDHWNCIYEARTPDSVSWYQRRPDVSLELIAAAGIAEDAGDRAGYVATLRRTLKPGGTAIIATFAPDGTPKCSGLDVVRYDRRSIAGELGGEFELRDVRRETHITPVKTEQQFSYFRFERPMA